MFYDDDNKNLNENDDMENYDNNDSKDSENDDIYESNCEEVDNDESNDDNNDLDNEDNDYNSDNEEPKEKTEEDLFYERMKRERNEYSEYDSKRDTSSKNDHNNNSYMSNKSVGIIVAICVVLAIICSVCVSLISASIKNNQTVNTGSETTLAPTTTNSKSNETTSNQSSQTQTDNTTETQAKAEPVSVESLNLTVSDVGGEALSVKDVFKKVEDSVVMIKATTSSGYGLGSGVCVTEDGYIMTNYHVANPSNTEILVEFSDGEQLVAQYVIGDESADIALIKVDKNDCVKAELANSDQVEIGDVAIAIGNALGRGVTLTAGHVSALSRTLSIDGIVMTLLQTDATINSGNSGGGLFNEYGQLIAIVNAKTGGSSVEGTGYAIPVNNALSVINDLQVYGYVTGKARLGITMSYLGSSLISNYTYIQVKDVVDGSSAALAGIQVGDIIYKIDGTELTSSTALQTILVQHKVGDTVEMVILRPTKDISEFRVTSWFGQISYDYEAYLNSCEQITISVTFVEFNPNN